MQVRNLFFDGLVVMTVSTWLAGNARTVKPSSPITTLCVSVAGKEYVGIVRLHNAIESEHTLARVSPCRRMLVELIISY